VIIELAANRVARLDANEVDRVELAAGIGNCTGKIRERTATLSSRRRRSGASAGAMFGEVSTDDVAEDVCEVVHDASLRRRTAGSRAGPLRQDRSWDQRLVRRPLPLPSGSVNDD